MGEYKNSSFYRREDNAAANIGRNDVPSEDPKRVQERLRQKQSDWDAEDRDAGIENSAERLYQLLEQEGLITEDETKDAYRWVHHYVSSGGMSFNGSEEMKFHEKVAEIQKWDEAGEWERTWTVGQRIEKTKKSE